MGQVWMVRNTLEVPISCDRPGIRAYLDQHGMKWTEHKRLLSSLFVVTGTRAQWDDLKHAVRVFNGD